MPRVLFRWLSGNVPLLGMFALIQSILTKNANILKVSTGESQALPLVLETFRELDYTTPGGYTIRGDDLLESLAVVYFDRHQTRTNIFQPGRCEDSLGWQRSDRVSSGFAKNMPVGIYSSDLTFDDGDW